MATLVVPALLRKLTSCRDSVAASENDIGQLLANLEWEFSWIRKHLIGKGDIEPSVAR
jgi:hypothetical protein